jgi:hypothetical protein
MCANCLQLRFTPFTCPNCHAALCVACMDLFERDQAARHQKAGCFGYAVRWY